DVDRLLARDHAVADGKALRRQDVAELAVLILDESDESRAVRIIFQTLDRARYIELAALEINDAIDPLVTTALKASGDAAHIVASALARKALRQALHGLALVEAGAVDDDQLALAWRYRFVILECHFLLPHGLSKTSRDVDRVAFGQRHDRFLD